MGLVQSCIHVCWMPLIGFHLWLLVFFFFFFRCSTEMFVSFQGFSATAQCQGHCFKAHREHCPGLSYCNQKVVLIANSSCDFRRLEQTRLILHRCLIASFLSLLAGTRYFLGSKKFNIILWKKLWQKGLTLTK